MARETHSGEDSETPYQSLTSNQSGTSQIGSSGLTTFKLKVRNRFGNRIFLFDSLFLRHGDCPDKSNPTKCPAKSYRTIKFSVTSNI